jgi:membrane protein DedA with SNARE-associated domain
MRSISAWIVGMAASPLGVTMLAFVDSTPLFALPGGIDVAVLFAAARNPKLSWVIVLLATAGSVAGAICTFWMGIKVGEHGLEHYISPRRLERVRARIRNAGAFQLAVLDLIPPPFPFTPVVLAAGALEVNASVFFRTLTACRILRFGIEATLASFYGSQIVSWLDSETLRLTVVFFGVVAVVLTIYSMAQLVRSSRASGRVPASSNG